MNEKKMAHKLDTLLVHAGEPHPRIQGAVSFPIFQSSTFEYGGEGNYHDVRYIRLNNTPNHEVLHAKLSAIEGTEAALVASSGMAAISSTLLTVLAPGDHLLAQRTLYGGTHDFVTQELVRLGIEHTFVDATDPASWNAALRPTTKAFYVETLTNPLVECGALNQVAAFATQHRLVSLIDNTFASPVNFRPADHGFTLTLESATKYLNGHSDIVCGVVAGAREWIDRIRHLLNHYGGSLDPHACFLLQRGLKTLALRVRAQNAAASALARALAGTAGVARVFHPSLPQHPTHADAKRLLGGFGGMLSFELTGGLPAAERLFQRLRLPLLAPSLGGPETLVVLPAQTSHAGMDPAVRRALGIGDGLVRVSTGLEDADELIADFAQALEA